MYLHLLLSDVYRHLHSFPTRRSSDLTLTEARNLEDPAVAEVLAHCDVLVDGLYLSHQPETRRRWVGSANQVVHFFTEDRKSTRLNSSHQIISYSVFFLKKKKHY